MDIVISVSGEVITVKIAGSIREKDASALKNAFGEILTTEQKVVNLDLRLAPYICSSALGTIIILYKQLKSRKRELQIKGIHDNLYSLFRTMNLQKMILIEKC